MSVIFLHEINSQITSQLLLSDLLSLSQVDSQIKKIATKALELYAENRGYTMALGGSTRFFSHLRLQFSLALHDEQKIVPQTMALDIDHNRRKKNRKPFPDFLRTFEYSSNGAKMAILSNEKIFEKQFAILRSLIHCAPSSSKHHIKNSKTIKRIVDSGEENLLEFLLTSIPPKKFKSTPLHFAAQSGQLDSLKYFIKKNPSTINHRGWLGATPLCFACGFKILRSHELNYEIVQLLLEQNANPNIPTDGEGQYPLHFAIHERDLDIVNLLIKHDADPKLKDVRGVSPKILLASLM